MYAADGRWLRRTLETLPLHEQRTKPFAKRFVEHDKAFERVAKIKDQDSEASAKALLDALEDDCFAREWDAELGRAKKRWEGGWRVLDDFQERIAAAEVAGGTSTSVEVLAAARSGVEGYLPANPRAFPVD